MNDATSLLIVTPNEIEGEGLKRLLIDGAFEVVGVSRSLDNAPSMLETVDFGMVLLRVPHAEANEQCRKARTLWPGAKIAVMARACDSAAVAEAFREGADGYLSIDTPVACLLDMLKLISLGEKLVPSQVVHELSLMTSSARVASEQHVDLSEINVSERELEILQGLIHGEPNKVISRRLNITEATVKVHVKSILRKLHVLNRTQAAVWALSHGLQQTSKEVKNGGGIPRSPLPAAVANGAAGANGGRPLLRNGAIEHAELR